jgi:hypothetical protein
MKSPHASPERSLGRRHVLAIALASLGLSWMASPSATAQEAFFHRGAQHFLAGSNALAKAEVENGLKLHPDNPNLQKFWELLNQQQQQNSEDQKDQKDQKDQQEQKDQKDQKNQKDQKDQKQDSSKDQQDKQQQQDKKDSAKDQQNSQPKPSDEQKKQEEQQDKDKGNSARKQDKDKDKEKKDEGQEGQGGRPQNPEENEGNPDGQPQGQAALRMTPQQAVRLLEALKNEERTLQFRPILRTNRTDRILKDW